MFIRGDKHPMRRDPSLLLVKSSWSKNNYDRMVVVAFDISSVGMSAIRTTRLRLNQVPSPIGFASRLPPVNVFSVYGLTDPAKDQWKIDSTWNESPAPEDGILLGHFTIPRSRSSGECILETGELLQFVREHQHRPITMVVIRKTAQIPGDGRGLVHAFASPAHPTVVGPTLEFEMTDEP
jgi:hypothetical protein